MAEKKDNKVSKLVDEIAALSVLELSELNKALQEKLGVTPHYKVLAEWGPDHNKNFEVGVFVNERQIAKGVGASKQE